MVAWSVLLPALGLLQGICIALDRFLLNREKVRLYYFLLGVLGKLDDSPARDYPKAVAAGTVRFLTRLAKPRGSYILGILQIVFLSCTLTFVALVVGSLLDPSSWESLESLSFNIEYVLNFKDLWQFLAVNLIFDSLTLLSTAWLLRKLVRGSYRLAVPIIFADAVLAVLFAFSCLEMVSLVHAAIWEYDFSLIVVSKSVLAGDVIPAALAFASTTLIPTVLYLALLLALLAAKPIVSAGRTLVLCLIKRATEVDDPKELIVFTLTGSLISVCALVIWSAIAIAKAVGE